MSKDLPQPNQSEEVDLGQLFKLIGNMFDRLFKFIGSIFNKLFLAFVWLILFVKKHFIKLVIAGVIGVGLGILLEKTGDPVYKSYITVKQNYPTGENLYNTIAYYNDLVEQNDTITLEKVLDIHGLKASSILEFDIESVISENDNLKNYDRYIKELDSTVASTVTFEGYIKNSKDYNHKYQQITIKSKERENFKTVFEKVVANINSNAYFKHERDKDIEQLKNKEQSLKNALLESKALQDTYKEVLTKTLENDNGAQTSVNIKTSDEENKTKEFELYKNDLELRNELVEVKRSLANKEHIIEIISSKQDSGAIDNRKALFGLSLSTKTYYGIILILITFIALLGLQMIQYLERFKDKV